MPTVTAQSIIDRAQVLLQDTVKVRWPDAELLTWLNEGQQAIVVLKPTAYVRSVAVQLVAGTKQSLPADGIQLIDIVRNMGTDGLTPGRAVRIVTREVMDAQTPSWHVSPVSHIVKHYMYSALDPNTFYVYPRQPASGFGYVEMAYGARPPAVAAVGNTISVDDIYQTALLDYVLYRAYSKDTEFADSGRAGVRQQAFVSAIVGKAQAEAGVSPNNTAPANPNSAPGAA
jgi:hypothetical protein